jgi:ABC-type glutathione transport system ATPase component
MLRVRRMPYPRVKHFGAVGPSLTVPELLFPGSSLRWTTPPPSPCDNSVMEMDPPMSMQDAPVATLAGPTMAAGAVDASKIYGKGESEVRAINGVSVGFEQGKFTAIMGPSGSGKSTLMHCVAGLDRLSGGDVFIGETYLSTLNEKNLTQLRRDKIGFIFQSFNLVPTLNALENIVLPMSLAGRKPDQTWLDNVVNTVGLGNRLTVSSNVWPLPVRWPASPPSSSLMSPPVTSTRSPLPRSCRSCGER